MTDLPQPKAGRTAATWVSSPVVLALLLAAAIVAMKLITGEIWEDFFITYRHCENFVQGHGLVYQPGERVHGFTSPINVLLPAIIHAFDPQGDHTLPLWGFLIGGLVVLVTGLSRFLRTQRELAPAGGAMESCLIALFLALQIKLTAFSFNGQEAAYWAGFLLLALSAINRGLEQNWRWAGVAFGGLMWTRPDSVVHIAALSLAALLFPVGSRKSTGRALGQAAALGAGIYLPWFTWAWWYYGSPVPHTILAKMGSSGTSPDLIAWLKQFPAAVSRAFEPIYAEAGGWPGWLHGVALVAGAACATAWLFPRLGPAGRRASLVFAVSAGYLAFVGASGFMFPWYFVPCGTMAAVLCAHLITRLPGRVTQAAVLLPLVAALGFGTVNSLAQLQIHQRLVEEQTRKQVGLWLRDNMTATETVFLEPIGYIGYYSGRHVLDWPGLVSPSVVAARRAVGNNFWLVLGRLHPDWLVLRPREAADFAAQPEAGAYQAVAEVNTLPQLQRYLSLPGYAFLSGDACFVIYRRRPAGKTPGS